MRQKLLLILVLQIILLPAVTAQDTINHLIFTYWKGDPRNQAFYQLTNVGDSSIDLSGFTLCNVNASATATSVDLNGVPVYTTGPEMSMRLSGRLDPGQSFLAMNVLDLPGGDGLPFQLEQLLPLADVKIHVQEFADAVYPPAVPELELWGFDSVSVHYHLIRLIGGLSGTELWYRINETDSVLIDQVNLAFNPATMKLSTTPSSVAGVPEATLYYDLVRKTSVKKGNPNWDNSRGVSSEDSEWLVLPKWPGRMIYTAVKNYGNFDISFESATSTINHTNKTISVPWSVERGDSILKEFTFGPGLAWQYLLSSNSADSAFNTARTGDILKVYSCGAELKEADYEISVAAPGPDVALVFPKRNYNFSLGSWTGISRYYVTKGNPVIDTIGNIPFATRVDTFITYLEKAPNAFWEIVWVDGTERVDLKHGDKLKVTAENGTNVKEYFIDVLAYVPSANADLAAITWPDIPDFLEGWEGDTIPLFNPNNTSYTLTIPYGTTSVPALRAIPSNLRAKVETSRATSLSGSLAERTTTFKVTAEDDSTTNEYQIIFRMEKPDELIQKFKGEPFISEVIMRFYNRVGMLEIAHAGNVPLDLSEYLFVRSTTVNPADAIANAIPNPTDANFQFRYRSYVPGYKYSDDTVTWKLAPGKLYLDPEIDPLVDPGDVFSMIAVAGRTSNITPAVAAVTDKRWDTWADGNAYWWDVALNIHVGNTPPYLKQGAEALFIYKIMNDSIFNGTKQIGDPNDFELVDAFGDPLADGIWKIAGQDLNDNFQGRARLKSKYYQGVNSLGEGNGTNADDSRWIIDTHAAIGGHGPGYTLYFGSHSIDPVTVYISTVTSLTYLVSDGFEGEQSIQGVLAGKSIEQFYMNISKADTGQTLTVKSGTDGTIKALSDLVASSDTLMVLSADGKNTTKYILIDQPLDDDAVLVAKEGSGYTIEIIGNTGKIKGINFSSTIREVLANLIKPGKAVLNIIDTSNNLVPLLTQTTSSEYIDGEWIYSIDYTDTKVGNSVLLEVIAQNGVNFITYTLEYSALSSDAYVISSVYNVDQENLIISGIPFQTSVSLFFNNIDIVRGAVAELTDKKAMLRELGIMWFDDKLVVTSEDQSLTVTYHLDFLTELEPDRPEEPNFRKEPSVQAPGQLTVYPNPAMDRIYVKGISGASVVYLTDLMGRTIMVKSAEELKQGIPLSDQPAGIYLIMVRDDNHSVRYARFVKY